MTHYLDVDDLIHIAERLAGRQVVPRDAGLLAAAAARPRANVRGADVYPSVAEKAAALFVSLAPSRAFGTGNRRVAWAATRLFCAANGAPLVVSDDEAVAAVEAVATGTVDVPALAAELGHWMTPEVVPDP